MHFGAFWCTSCATPWPLHDLLWLLYPSKCPFTPEMGHMSHSGQIRNTFLCDGTVTILVYFGPFWCTSWATPWPFFIKFSSSHQKHVSNASRAFKRDQSHFPSSGNTDLTWALSMGKSRKKLPPPGPESYRSLISFYFIFSALRISEKFFLSFSFLFFFCQTEPRFSFTHIFTQIHAYSRRSSSSD